MPKNRVIIIGGGLAGLMAAIKSAERGLKVDLFSLVPVKRSHSVCAQGGINGAVNTMGEGDSTWEHFDDTVYGGDFLANQPPVRTMTDRAPSVIYMLDRMGVPFNRTSEGFLDFRRFGGAKQRRTAFAGATTGQQLLYALDEQVRRHECEGAVNKYEGWDFLGIVKDDDGICRGIIAQSLYTMEIRSFRADAVIMATGGPGYIYGKSTQSIINTGSAVSFVYQQGAKYGNPEMIQVHPTAIPGEDKNRLMSEGIRGEGGRVWVPRNPAETRAAQDIPEADRLYFLEEKYPAYGNLVPRDIATREIFDICVNQKLGVEGKNQVYLDITHLDRATSTKKLWGILEIYIKFKGKDPRDVPMLVFPSVHYSMGGLWVNYESNADGFLKPDSTQNMATNIPGLYAVGECEYQFHGANRLGANALLSCIFAGGVSGEAVSRYVKGLDKSTVDMPSSLFDSMRGKRQSEYDAIVSLSGTENPYKLHDELGDIMTENVTVVRYNDRLEKTLLKISEIKSRMKNVGLADTGVWTNQAAIFTRNLQNMLVLAETITTGALKRDESRGAHYKPDFPSRNDEKFLKSTIAEWKNGKVEISYADVDHEMITPRLRNYAKDKSTSQTGEKK
ncbi:MAG: succinate dehydrogenase flavoprotein subunit [Armatimonadota bacterium]